MKKFLTLLMMFATFGFMAQGATNPSASELQQNAVEFDWVNGNDQYAADGTKWYKVDLTQVATDENLLLYLNNVSTADANVTVRVALVFGTTVQIQDEASSTRTIAPNKNYAKEVSHSLFKNVQTVYVELTTTQHVVFSAEPVEPGEKTLDCLNAPDFVRAGTVHAAGTESWYRVDLTGEVADPSKSIQVTVKNNGTSTATVTGGLSMDCPSSGTTDKTFTIAAGASRTFTAKRSYIELVGDEGMVYVRVKSNQELLITATQVNAPSTETYTISDVTDIDVDVQYTLNAGQTKWYKLDLSKVDVKRHQPEVTVENKSNATTTIDGVLIYANDGDALTGVQASDVRSVSIAAGDAWVKEIQRNIVEASVGKYQYAYVRLTTSKDIEFITRLKARNAGTQCLTAIDFDWNNGNVQTGESTVWYAVSLVEAKSDANKQKDILITVDNLNTTKKANLAAQVSTACPCDVTQDFNRTIEAGKQISKTLKHSLYSVISADTVWVGVTTDQNIHIYAELVDAPEVDTIYACHDSIEFDWDNGHLQTLEAGATVDTAWYAVPIYKLLSEANLHNQVPEITVTNRGNSTATITAQLSFECPVVTEMQSRTIALAAGEQYVKSPTLDLINSIDTAYEYIYIRVITTQDISIQAKFKYEEEGKYCSTAEEFNWTIGADYVASEPYWYSVDISDARQNEQDIVITLTNNNNYAVNVKAEVTAECPIVNGTTSYNYTIAANSTKQQKLTYATLYAIGSDVVYVRVTAAGNLHIDAVAQSDASAVTNICEGADAVTFVDFDWENGHVQGAETVWYRVALDTLRQDLVPQVVVENLGNGETSVRGEVAFKCEVKLESMMGKTIVLNGKNATYERTADKATMALIDSTQAYAYIRVTSTDSIRFNGGLVNPNTGDECYTAVEFPWDNGVVQNGGDTIWYKVDLTYVTSQPNKAVTVGIKNLDGFRGVVHADLFFTCEDTVAFESQSYTLGGNSKKELKLGRELLVNLAVDEVLIRLYTDQQDSLYAYLYDEESQLVPIDGCDEAIEAQLNLIIEQAAGVGQWYYVDIADIKAVDENGETYVKGNALLEIWNSSEVNTMTAYLAWDCPATEKMLDKTLTLGADQEYERTIQRSLIDNINKDIAYVYVYTEKDMKFRVTMEDLRGSACLNPIEYDWENGNTHPAADSLWYKISLDTLNTDYAKDKDLRITVYNLSENTADATAVVMQGCGVNDTLGTASRTLAALDSLSKEISHVVIDSILQGEPIYVYLTSTENVYLHAELIGKMDPVIVDTLIVDTICDGSIYWAYVANGDSVAHLISSDEVTQFPVTWIDTIPFIYDNILDADSIRRYEIHLMSMPQAPAISELPIKLYAGRAMDFTEVNDSIIRYFNANAADTVATVDPTTLVWEYYDPVQQKIVPVTNEKLGFDEKQVILVYSITTSCGDVIGSDQFGTTIELDTTYIHRDTIQTKVCKGEEVTIGGVDYTITSDISIIDTFLVVDWDATLKQDVDSIITYNFLVWKEPDLITTFETEDMPVAQLGKAVDVSNTTVAIKTEIADQQLDTMLVALKDTVIWQILEDNNYVALTDKHIDSVASVTLRYGLRSDVCDTIYYSENIVVNTTPKDSAEHVWNDTVCYLDTYYTHDHPEGISISENVVITERFSYAVSAEQDIDSIYTYNIFVYVDYTAETLTTIETQVGKVLSTADAEAELKQKLDAQNAADPLKDTYTDVVWEVKSGNYTLGEHLTSDAAITLGYTVNTKHGCATLTGEVAVNIAAVDSVVEYVQTETLCVGSTYSSRLDNITVNDDMKWTERVALADKTDDAQWKDSVYVYELYVYEVPAVKAIETLPTASCGQPVVVDAATDALFAAFEPEGNVAPVDSIVWQINTGKGWADLTNEALNTRIGNFDMRYKAYTICGNELVSDAVTITVADDCVEVVEDIFDTVCVNTEYITRLQTIQVTDYTEITNVVTATDENGNKFDSVYNYYIYVYKELELPAQEDFDILPEAVCGEEVRLDGTIEELNGLFTADELTEPYESITWEIDLGNGYEPLTDQVMTAALNTIALRYTVVGECNTKQGELNIKVQKPNSTNMPDKYEEQQAVEKYEGWLLMINYNKLSAKAEELGLNLTEESVVWYKVNGEPDITTEDATDLPDDSVGIGYYYTKSEILPAGEQYYALVKIPVTVEDECGGSMYTNFLTIQQAAAPLNIAPNIVKPGEDMYITGLNRDAEYTISVYDLTGVRVENFNVSDTDTFTLQAQAASGYYMVQVSSSAENVQSETLKYVVK